MPQDEEDEDRKDRGPRRQGVDEVPLGIRKPKGPGFDSDKFKDRQREEDERREAEQLRRVEEESLEPPEQHQDYEIQDGEEFDRHLEGITTVNAIKELILQAKEEVEEELDVVAKPFRPNRMDELMVFTREAVTGYGEDNGYAELKKRVRDLIEEDLRIARAEMDRKKEAYLRSSGK